MITGLNMPGPNGWKILERLHGRPGIPPIVMASGYADEETTLEWGTAAFRHKPLSQAEIVQTVNRLLDRE
ncbi:MAG: response regulator [Dehalococcoidia bacterium]|nr:MAG: response regulator [Dehalococcoidia bacterium]